GSAIDVSGVDTRHLIYNNIIVAKPGQTTFFCGNSGTTPSPVVNSSDVFSEGGLAYGGTCVDQTGSRSNLSVDPLFVRNAVADIPGDYHLRMSSPAIDAGDNAAPSLPPVDLDGQPRIADGNGDSDARVDLGAYEVPSANRPPVANAGPDQSVSAGAN